MAKRSVDVNWKNATKVSSFQTEPLKSLWDEYSKAREATTLAFKKAAEANKLEAKEAALKAGLIKSLKAKPSDDPLHIPAGKTRKIALKYDVAISAELFDENATGSTGSKKGITL